MIRKRNQLITALALSFFTSSCALQTITLAPALTGSAVVQTTVEGCRSALRAPAAVAETGLGSSIDLLNWNIKKGSKTDWQSDLREMALDSNLVILQEAAVEIGIEQEVPHLSRASFARGYSSRNKTTGVATYGAAAPLNECHFNVMEPFLRTPKATSVAEFPLAEKSETLLVVNVHAVNFTLGVGRFSEQMQKVRDVIDAHDGPAILGGDFNTWSQKRSDIVDQLAADLGFSSVPLLTDDRTTFNGFPLDHVFVRGFSSANGNTTIVRSSDHNPMTIELVL